MANILSQLIVQLVDQVSGPARSVGRSVEEMNRKIRETASRPLNLSDRLDAAMTRNNRAIEAARGQLIDAVAGFYALRTAIGAPIQSAMRLETTLSGISSKAGMSADQIGRLRDTLREASRQTNQYAADLASGVDYLVGMGMSGADATAAIRTIGLAATASGAKVEDMSAAGFAAMSNLKIPADQLLLALDAMSKAGKSGGFELKDMASYFPSLGAAYASMGQSGVGAVADLSAALQVIRSDTGDASSAATNLQNVIQKTFAPGTIKKFDEAGVDLFREMEAAAKRGLTPIEAIAEITNKTLKGDLSRIGYLFEDSQAQAGVRSLIQRMDQFRKIREEAMGAGGTNQADFDRTMGTTAEKVKAAQIAFENFKESLGTALLPVLGRVSEMLIPIIDAFGRFADNNPTLVAALASAAAGFIGLKAAIAGLSFIGLVGKGGALSMLSFAVNGLGGAMGRVGRNMGEMTRLQRTLAEMNGQKFTGLDAVASAAKGLALAAPGAGTFVSGLSGLGGLIATISAPAWGTFAIAAAAIGGAGLLIWRYWDRLTSIMSGVGSAIGDLLAPALEKARPILDWFAPLGDAIARGWEAAKSAVSAVGDWIGSIFQQETLTDADKEKARQAGYDFVMALWNGMKQVFADLTGWVSAQVDKITAPVRNLASKVSGMFSGGAEGVSSDPMGTGVDGQRAKGGPISRGSRYLVGERGPELITAGRSGYVNPAGSATTGGVIVSPVFNMTFNGRTDADDVVEKIRRVMRDEVRETFRGVFADTGMRFA